MAAETDPVGNVGGDEAGNEGASPGRRWPRWVEITVAIGGVVATVATAITGLIQALNGSGLT